MAGRPQANDRSGRPFELGARTPLTGHFLGRHCEGTAKSGAPVSGEARISFSRDPGGEDGRPSTAREADSRIRWRWK